MNSLLLKATAAFFFLLAALTGCGSPVPDVPARPWGPDSGVSGVPYEFAAVTTSPTGDSVSYQFYWGDKDTSDWSGFVPSGVSGVLTKAWRTGDRFALRARARNRIGGVSDWSDEHEVVIQGNSPPYIPSIPQGPEEGNPYVPYAFTSFGGDPDGDSISLRFAYGYGDTSEWSPYVPNRSPVSIPHLFSYIKDYEIRAQARDVHGAVSWWSDACDFTVSRLRWRFRTNGQISSSPAIGADGVICFGSWDGWLYALYPDGNRKWRIDTDSSIQSSPAIGADGTVYVGSDNGGVYAVDTAGALLWSYATGGGVQSSPAIGPDGTIYVGSHDHYLYALNPDGTLKWRFETGHGIQSSPAVAPDGTIYFGSNDGNFYALKPDGTLKWRFEGTSGYWIVSSPAIGSDGTIYYGSKDNHVYALNPDGTLKWRFHTFWVRVESSPVIGPDGTIYIGSHDSNLYAFDPDGTVKWTYDVRWAIISAPAVTSRGLVYFGSEDRYLYCLWPDGTLRWRYRTGWRITSSPAVAPDGTIYFGSWDRRLYSLVGTGRLADTPWPMFRQNLQHTGRRH